jgi:uncharacterized protein (DUF58 family)
VKSSPASSSKSPFRDEPKAGAQRLKPCVVPAPRLIFFAAVTLPPFAVLAALWPPALLAATLLGSAIAIVAVLDAFRGASTLRTIRLEFPDTIRLSKNRPGTFSLKIHRPPEAPHRLRIALAFPHEISTPEDSREIELPRDAAASTIVWTCTPHERGLFRIDTAALETPSPLGLWNVRTRVPTSVELRCYPDLLAERQRVSALFLRRSNLGTHAQRSAGQGREFEKLRAYLPGDSLGDIHWKASAKRGHLVTKLHQIERSHEVYVIVDASRLSARLVPGDVPVPALDRYVSAALILGAAAERQGDQFGLITFGDRIHTFLRARNGPAHFDTCRDRLYTLQPRPVTPDFHELCAFLRARLTKRALLIFLTALDDPFLAESFIAASQLITRQHLLLVNMLRPPGVRPVFENTAVSHLDDLYRELGGHLQWEKLRELQGILHQRGIRFHLLDPVMIAAELVQQHSQVRERELI